MTRQGGKEAADKHAEVSEGPEKHTEVLGCASTGWPQVMEENPAPQEEANFNAAEASGIVKECLDVILSEVDYDASKVNQWMSSVVEQSLTHLVKLGKAYKYIVSCTVMQKSGSGLHTASSCFWDNNTDGTCTVRWENRTMCCVVNVFAVAIIL